MKKSSCNPAASHLLAAFTLLMLSAPLLGAQCREGTYTEGLTLQSTFLGMERKYSVYLPYDYGTSSRYYPVLYLLHGSGDDHSSWEQFGEVKHTADKAISEGYATPMVIVMPDCHEGYFDELCDSWKGESYFFGELIPFIEKEYRIRPGRQFRAICGLSMGGGAAIGYALRHPEMFSSSCPLSAAPGPRDFDEYMQRARRRVGEERVGKLSREELDANYIETNLIEKWRSLDGEALEEVRKVRWYFDCGDDDHLSVRLGGMREAIDGKKVPHEWRVRDGAHNWRYWRESLPEVLHFVSSAFHR